MFLKLIFSIVFLISVLFFLDMFRKKLLPKPYYAWEEKIKTSLEGNLKQSSKFIFLFTLIFLFLFYLMVYFDIRPWFSIWVLLLGFWFAFLKSRKITILEKMYFSAFFASIIPSLILARLLFIDSFLFLVEYLGSFTIMQQKTVITAVTSLLVLPEGAGRKLADVIQQLFDKTSWRSKLAISDSAITNIIAKNKSLNSVVIAHRWDEVLGRIAFKENVMHLGKVSNLVNSHGESVFSQYKYKTVLDSFIKMPTDLYIKSEQNVAIISILNSAEFTEYISNLKGLRKTMSAGEFSKVLKEYLTKSNFPDLTKEEGNLLYHIIFTKAVTSELPTRLLIKETLDILYDSSKEPRSLELAASKAVVKILNNSSEAGFDKIFDEDAYMKLIKEQEGVAMQERYLKKMGLTIIDAERDSLVDYKLKLDRGDEILLECKSIAPEFLNVELRELQLKLEEGQSLEFYWENTRTWEKTLFKVTKDGYQEIYKEGAQK